eukprot:496872_1
MIELPPDIEGNTNDDNNTDASDKALIATKTNILGMLLLTISTFLFQTNSTIVKFSKLSLIQMLWFRNFIALLIGVFVWKLKTSQSHINQPWYVSLENRRIAWIIGMSCNFSSIFYWIGIHLVPVGDASCIFLFGPVFVSLIGHYYLNDPLAKTFVLTFFGSIISIIILAQPSFIFHKYNIDKNTQPLSVVGVLALLTGSVSFVTAVILTRKANDIHAFQILIIETFQGVFIWCPIFFIFDIYIIKSEEVLTINWWVILFGIGIGISHYLAELGNTFAYQIGNSTKITWFEYTDLLIAYIYQSLLFDEIPNKWEIIGCVSIIAFSFLPLCEELFVYMKNSTNNRIQYSNVPQESSVDESDDM